MNTEKRNIKNFNIIIIIVLAAMLVTTIGGIIMQRQIIPFRDSGLGMGRDTNLDLLQPESAQSSPTGTMVMSTGILLLLAGFGVLVATLWIKRNSLHGNST